MTRPDITMDYIMLEISEGDFMCLSGERIETEGDPSVYPFGHAVTFRLSPQSAERIGQDTITVPESAILQNCELPKATDLPTADLPTADLPTVGTQTTLFGSDDEMQLSLF